MTRLYYRYAVPRDDAPAAAGEEDAPAAERAAAAGAAGAPADFSLLYESADGKLCVFETRDGHVSAVDAARLA